MATFFKYKSDEEFSDTPHNSTVDDLPECMSASHFSSSCVSRTMYTVGVYSYLTAYTVLSQAPRYGTTTAVGRSEWKRHQEERERSWRILHIGSRASLSEGDRMYEHTA